MAGMRHRSRLEKNPARTEKGGIRTFERRRVRAYGRATGHGDRAALTDTRQSVNGGRNIVSCRRYGSLFRAEIHRVEGEVQAGLARRQAVRGFLAAHMARFAAFVRVVGAKAKRPSAANRRERHTAGGDKRRQFSQSVFAFHEVNYTIFGRLHKIRPRIMKCKMLKITFASQC